MAGQAQHLRAQLAQVALDLLLLRALDVVLGGVLQVSLDLPRHITKPLLDDKGPEINPKRFCAKYGAMKIEDFKAFNSRLSGSFNCIFTEQRQTLASTLLAKMLHISI